MSHKKVSPRNKEQPSGQDQYRSKMARSPDFLQQSFVTNNEKKSKAKEIDLQDLGEDNLSALELYLNDLDQEKRPESRKSDIIDSQKNNVQTPTSNTPKDGPCLKQEKEQNDSRSKSSSKRCCSSVMIAIFIFISLVSLFINVLMIKGVIVPSGCQRIESRKGWYYAHCMK